MRSRPLPAPSHARAGARHAPSRSFEYLLRRTPAASSTSQAEYLQRVVVPAVEATLYVEAAGTCAAYLDATTVFTLDRLRFELRTLFLTQTPRHKLANDGTRFAAGQAVLTPKGARGLVLGLAQSWEARGLIENLEAFKADLIAERNSLDPNRLDIYLPPDLVNGLVVVAAQLGFRL